MATFDEKKNRFVTIKVKPHCQLNKNANKTPQHTRDLKPGSLTPMSAVLQLSHQTNGTYQLYSS